MKEGVVVADGDGNREAGSGEASQNMMYTLSLADSPVDGPLLTFPINEIP